MERTDIEVASRRVDMGSCLRPPSYPRGSFSVISSPHRRGHWGSLGPAFASEFLTVRNTVRLAYALTLYSGSLSHLNQPYGRVWYLFKRVPPQPNCPSTNVHNLKIAMLETQSQESSVSWTTQICLTTYRRSLLLTLHTCNQASIADCSKTLRGLRFPIEVSGLCTRIAGSLGSS